ncbi:hypothetical protein [Halanaerobium salsuginis]|uniref:Uncharacterized protein n=1 Tax=Halanaerobium salsuginis TaxID=29563 RepID=A0A1I4G0Q8_9FIRM|nr:hypothetical protein [Halanaerobium salsuginis]SFL22797.1 hypothetical protein SAMN02983006_00551 [Halanaerobium salsuginis]
MKYENDSKLDDLKEKLNVTKGDLELIEEFIVGNQLSRISFNINNYINDPLIKIQPDFRWSIINDIERQLQRLKVMPDLITFNRYPEEMVITADWYIPYKIIIENAEEYLKIINNFSEYFNKIEDFNLELNKDMFLNDRDIKYPRAVILKKLLE